MDQLPDLARTIGIDDADSSDIDLDALLGPAPASSPASSPATKRRKQDVDTALQEEVACLENNLQCPSESDLCSIKVAEGYIMSTKNAAPFRKVFHFRAPATFLMLAGSFNVDGRQVCLVAKHQALHVWLVTTAGIQRDDQHTAGLKDLSARATDDCALIALGETYLCVQHMSTDPTVKAMAGDTDLAKVFFHRNEHRVPDLFTSGTRFIDNVTNALKASPKILRMRYNNDPFMFPATYSHQVADHKGTDRKVRNSSVVDVGPQVNESNVVSFSLHAQQTILKNYPMALQYGNTNTCPAATKIPFGCGAQVPGFPAVSYPLKIDGVLASLPFPAEILNTLVRAPGMGEGAVLPTGCLGEWAAAYEVLRDGTVIFWTNVRRLPECVPCSPESYTSDVVNSDFGKALKLTQGSIITLPTKGSYVSVIVSPIENRRVVCSAPVKTANGHAVFCSTVAALKCPTVAERMAVGALVPIRFPCRWNVNRAGKASITYEPNAIGASIFLCSDEVGPRVKAFLVGHPGATHISSAGPYSMWIIDHICKGSLTAFAASYGASAELISNQDQPPLFAHPPANVAIEYAQFIQSSNGSEDAVKEVAEKLKKVQKGQGDEINKASEQLEKSVRALIKALEEQEGQLSDALRNTSLSREERQRLRDQQKELRDVLDGHKKTLNGIADDAIEKLDALAAESAESIEALGMYASSMRASAQQHTQPEQ